MQQQYHHTNATLGRNDRQALKLVQQLQSSHLAPASLHSANPDNGSVPLQMSLSFHLIRLLRLVDWLISTCTIYHLRSASHGGSWCLFINSHAHAHTHSHIQAQGWGEALKMPLQTRVTRKWKSHSQNINSSLRQTDRPTCKPACHPLSCCTGPGTS